MSVSEQKVAYRVLQSVDNNAKLDIEHRLLSTRNLDELERDLAEVERMLMPLLNKLRELRNKKPVFVPK